MILLALLVAGIPLELEMHAGLVFPGCSSSDTPTVFYQPSVAVPIGGTWNAVLTIPYWKTTDFNPSSGYPDYTDMADFWIDSYQSYSERTVCIMAGARKYLGPLSLQISGGVADRTFKVRFDPGDIDGYYYEEIYEDSQFTGAFSVSVESGNHSSLTAAVTLLDSEIHVGVSTGLSISGLLGEL